MKLKLVRPDKVGEMAVHILFPITTIVIFVGMITGDIEEYNALLANIVLAIFTFIYPIYKILPHYSRLDIREGKLIWDCKGVTIQYKLEDIDTITTGTAYVEEIAYVGEVIVMKNGDTVPLFLYSPMHVKYFKEKLHTLLEE